MQLAESTTYMFMAGVLFCAFILAFALVRPCAPNDEVEKAMCDRKGGTWRIAIFFVICANVVGMGAVFVGGGVASQLDLPSLYFNLSGLFTWPDYTISLSADLIRLFL